MNGQRGAAQGGTIPKAENGQSIAGGEGCREEDWWAVGAHCLRRLAEFEFRSGILGFCACLALSPAKGQSFKFHVHGARNRVYRQTPFRREHEIGRTDQRVRMVLGCFGILRQRNDGHLREWRGAPRAQPGGHIEPVEVTANTEKRILSNFAVRRENFRRELELPPAFPATFVRPTDPASCGRFLRPVHCMAGCTT
jgi:hypothetical protein